MEVMSIGYGIPGYSEDIETIDSRRAISDVDLVLIRQKHWLSSAFQFIFIAQSIYTINSTLYLLRNY